MQEAAVYCEKIPRHGGFRELEHWIRDFFMQGLGLFLLGDFEKQADREAAEKHVRVMKPRFLIGSPVCTMFSALQNLRRWTWGKERRWLKAVEHIEFMVKGV